ncbi:lipoyl(octanoyl) transferase LipB [Sporomusa acidovorans]|uniref:Octanoyltransferase n=1 Tax=Sporomusa acidovorans (strain ATCC 49682 / DSM 3132 / Mol) TaxID=1123286 RepID=A0ABZ3J6H6_SPOA4|nr:lipoyl(octanoyl) transferase LipB [Sporomusa acidovorans]OZC15647.1 octanoyltransferase [Sporomusa acidovorans DSM 3132]SDE88138.1 lipoyl(octanoyl) transferase [Sporomusa acidovorans]
MKNKTRYKTCQLLHLGLLPYQEAWQFQQELAAKRRSGTGQDTLLFVEHLPVYTIGRGGSRNNIKVSDKVLRKRGLEVIEVDRGGDITYHGPGQLVGYPILDLRGYRQDLHYYSTQLEEVIIRTLAKYRINSFREPGLTGVWTERGKIAAIGIGARSWVTMHGFSLNINPDMSYFDMINPCGITDRPVVSMRELGIEVSLAEVGMTLLNQFADIFEVNFADEVVSTGRYTLG